MQLLHYANGALLTGTDIAHALVDYAESLARHGSSASVDIPIREADGSLGRANFLIGPASQIVGETTSSDYDEVVDTELVASMRARTARLEGGEVQITDQVTFDEVSDTGLEYGDDL